MITFRNILILARDTLAGLLMILKIDRLHYIESTN